MNIIIIFTVLCALLAAYTEYGRRLYIKYSAVNAATGSPEFVRTLSTLDIIKYSCGADRLKNPAAAAVFRWLPILLWISARSVSESMRQSSYTNKKRLTAGLLSVSMVLPAFNAAELRSMFLDIPEAGLFAADTSTVVTNTNNSGIGSLRQAIANAKNGDTVTFNIKSDGTQTIALSSALSIGGKLIVIDASTQGAAVKLTVDGYYRHITSPSSSNTPTLKGLTLDGNGIGGGINASSIILYDCIIKNNTADYGGGIKTNGNITAYNCRFINNESTSTSFGGDGGGLYTSTTVNVYNCEFTGNTVVNYGGGIFAGIAANVFNSSFIGNSADNGGGIYVNSSNKITAVNSTFAENTTANTVGGTIQSASGEMFFLHCTVAKNNGNGTYTTNKLYSYNSIFDGNSGSQYISSGNTLQGSGAITGNASGTLFNNNIVTFGYIMPLPGVSFVKTAPTITEADLDAITDGAQKAEILAALQYDQAGNRRSGSAVTYGAVEPTARTWVANTYANEGESDYIRSVLNSANADSEPDYRVITFDQSGGDNLFSSVGEIAITKNTIIYGMTNDSGEPQITFSARNTCRVFNCSADSLMLYGLTLENGKAQREGGAVYAEGDVYAENVVFKNNEVGLNTSDTSFNGFGGGLYSRNGNVKLKNCEFNGNSAALGNGGGVCTEAGDITAEGCVFTGNTADWYGGGLYSKNDALIYNCGFYENSGELSGGGAFADVNVEVKNSWFEANTTLWHGGGVNANKNVTADNCVFIKNEARWGGGINVGQDAELSECSFMENKTKSVYDESIGENIGGNGGGVFSDFGSVKADSCEFVKNEAVWNGGGIYSGIDLSVEDSVFTKNKAVWGGGVLAQGVWASNSDGSYLADGGNVAARNCVFTGNTASDNVDSGAGGGIYANGGIIASDGCEFTENIAFYGGGAYAETYDVIMNDCTFNENTGLYYGGGINAWYGNVEIKDSTFNDNTGEWGGGGLYAVDGDVNVSDSVFTGNSVTQSDCEGGGIYAGGTAKAVNCGFSDNSASSGGALSAGTVTAVNCMVTGNETVSESDGTLNALGTLTLYHCTVAMNTGNGAYASDLCLYNSIIAGNTEEQALYENSIDGDSLIEGENNLNYAKIFGVNVVDSDGFIKVLGGGKADGTADAVSVSDIGIMNSLTKDFSGATRAASGKVTYGALEETENGISSISGTISRNYGDDLDLQDSELMTIVYSDGSTGTLPLTDPDIAVSGYVSSSMTQSVTLGYLNAAGMLTVNMDKASSALQLTVESDGSHNREVTLKATLTGFSDGFITSETIKFTDGATELGTADTDENGEATLTVSSLSDGTHNIAADFEGNAVYNEATSSTVTVTTTTHSWGEWTETKAPTCTEIGEEERECSVCHETEIRDINMLPHSGQISFDEVSGETYYTCDDCGAEYDYEDHTHSFGDWNTTVTPTCTATGSRRHVCSDCNYVETETLDIDGDNHDYSVYWTTDTAPSCETAGSKSHHCTRCGDKGDITPIPALGHNYQGEITKEATCTETGTTTFTCTNDSAHTYTEEIEIDSVNHAYSADWTVDTPASCEAAGSKSHHCTRCGDKSDITPIPALGHNYQGEITKEATCTETGTTTFTCTNDNAHTYTEEIEIDSVNHAYSADWTVDTAASCEAAGSKSRYCTRCGDKGDITPIPALGHNYQGEITREATCTEKGTKTFTCTNDSAHKYTEDIDYVSHTYSADWTVDTAASCEAAGSKSRHCIHCGDKSDITPIPATGHTWGDWLTVTPATSYIKGLEKHICSVCLKEETRDIPMIESGGTVIIPEPKPEPVPTPEPAPSTEPAPVSEIEQPVPNFEGIVEKNVEKDATAPETILNTEIEELKNIVFTAEETERINAGEDAKVFITVEDISEKVSAEEKAFMEENLGEFTMGLYLDISLFKQIGESEAVKLAELGKKISITITIPDELRVDGRNYKILRLHNGEIEIIDGIYDPATGEFTFETDRFSTYALIVSDLDEFREVELSNAAGETLPDNSDEKNPLTGNPVMPALFEVFSAGIVIVTFAKRKKIQKK